MKNLIRIACIAGVIGFFSQAFAGTIINANLPANTAIININATQDGANGWNGDQSLWYRPFNTGGTLLTYTIQAGTYTFRVVDPADAAQLFPALTPPQTNQIYTGWTYNNPWIENYLVFDSAAATDYSLYQIIYGAPSLAGYGDATMAYQSAITTGIYDQIHTGPLGVNAPTNYTYTFATNETLIFVVPDYGLYDNYGGVSVLISPMNSAPTLHIAAGVGVATLQWTTNSSGYTLAQTTNLQNAAWSDVAPLPTVIGSNYSVTVPLDLTTNRFFRLHNP